MLDVTSKVPSVTTDNNILILNQSQQQNTLATWHLAHAAWIQTWHRINEHTWNGNMGVALCPVSQVNKWKNYGFIEWAACVGREQTPTSDIIKHNGKVRRGTPQLGIAAMCSTLMRVQFIKRLFWRILTHSIADQIVKIKCVACAIVFT